MPAAVSIDFRPTVAVGVRADAFPSMFTASFEICTALVQLGSSHRFPPPCLIQTPRLWALGNVMFKKQSAKNDNSLLHRRSSRETVLVEATIRGNADLKGDSKMIGSTGAEESNCFGDFPERKKQNNTGLHPTNFDS